ncbi:hypothetical protein H310_05559 [Aphanomyces invadans]|uniref:Uncharacterized protein n=1 Tax=Aphanomyces invadans TaxID=157072 RepID=A0A024UB56_9STRA|nr:hypothetical protein H310_05559 [Aphanomyces invadans]ETW03137.1 hypothetical protein H310_05559 [Aphanomyces invadans]|eukprot:XP_008868521.1 hypothetical protein H310_05559 [Aphanomyces invadans]
MHKVTRVWSTLVMRSGSSLCRAALEAQMEEHRLKYQHGRYPSPARQRHEKVSFKLPQLAAPASTTPTNAELAPNLLASPRTQRKPESTADVQSVVRQLQADLVQQTQIVQRLSSDMNEKYSVVMQRLLELVHRPSPVVSQIPATSPTPLLHSTLTHHATRLDALERSAVAASTNALLRADFDATTTMLVENKAQVVAQVTSLGDRVRAVEGMVSLQCPTWSHFHEINSKFDDAIAKLRVEMDRTMVVHMRHLLDDRDKLHQESKESQAVLTRLTSTVDARRQDAVNVRLTAVEADLAGERRAGMDLDVALQNKLDQVVTAAEAAMVKVDAWQRVEQARWAQWTAQHIAACDAQLTVQARMDQLAQRTWSTNRGGGDVDSSPVHPSARANAKYGQGDGS